MTSANPSSTLDLKHTIFDVLQYPNAIKWAADGRLAILVSTSVAILQYPGEDHNYTRYEAGLHTERRMIDCGTVRAQDIYDERDAMITMLHRTSGQENIPVMLIAMDWSPLGCAWDGNCLLATLSTDSVLTVWAQSMESKAMRWEQVCSVSDLWADYVFRCDFNVQEGGSSTTRKANMNGARSREGPTGFTDVDVWTSRQQLVSIDALAWSKDCFPPASPTAREEGGSGEGGTVSVAAAGGGHTTLLAVGGPEVLSLWLFEQGALASSFTPKRKEPVALLKMKDVANIAWMRAKFYHPQRPGGSSSTSPATTTRKWQISLAVASAFGAVDLLQVNGSGDEWTMSHLRNLSPPDMSCIQSLACVESLPVVQNAVIAAKGTQLVGWAIELGEVIEGPLEAHNNLITSIDFTRASDGSGPCIVTSGLDGQIQVWRIEREDTLNTTKITLDLASTASIPTRREGLLGLAVSPNNVALALARVAEGDEGNTRLLQFNRRLKKNHAAVSIQPMFQTGWRSVILPQDPQQLMEVLEWRQLFETARDAAPALPTFIDLLFVAHVDFTALMATQVHPEFLTAEGTNDEEAAAADGEGKKAAGRESKLKKPEGSKSNWEVPVDVTGLPEGSGEIITQTAFSRLVNLFDIWPGVLHQTDNQVAKPVAYYQALHALHAHLANRLFRQSKYRVQENEHLQLIARTHITASYIDRSLTKLLSRLQGRGGAGEGEIAGAAAVGIRLTREEKQIALTMVKWIRIKRDFLQEKQITRVAGNESWDELASEILRLACGGPEGEQDLVEKCFLCDQVVPFEDDFGSPACCSSGHILTRCMESLLIIETPELWNCPICNSMARPHLPAPQKAAAAEGDDDEMEEVVGPTIGRGRGAWLRRLSWLATWQPYGIWCLFCNVPCNLVNA